MSDAVANSRGSSVLHQCYQEGLRKLRGRPVDRRLMQGIRPCFRLSCGLAPPRRDESEAEHDEAAPEEEPETQPE